MSVARDRSAQRPRGGGGRLLRPEPYESNLPANTWAFTIRRERRPARLSARLWSFGRASPSGSQAVSVGSADHPKIASRKKGSGESGVLFRPSKSAPLPRGDVRAPTLLTHPDAVADSTRRGQRP